MTTTSATPRTYLVQEGESITVPSGESVSLPAGPMTAQQLADVINANSQTFAEVTEDGELRLTASPLPKAVAFTPAPSRHRQGPVAQGLTPARLRVLTWLADHPHSTLAECAADLGITRSGVAFHHVWLAVADLIERSTAARSRGTRLTPAGWLALGRRPACPTCHRPFLTPGDLT
jgi:hypothetical protein